MSNVFVFRRPPHGVITEYFGGGKGGSTTTTNNVTQIPPEVLARYNAVNARAETVAQAPYQAYSQDPNAFVAPLSQTQQAGIQNTNAMAGAAQPYYGAATGLAAQSTGSVNPSALNVGQYMNPYTQSVVNATQAAMNQQQGQQLSQQQADAIRGGAFGGDRAGLQRAQLMGQQSLAQAQAIAPLYQQNYNQALAAAQQQQGVGLGAEQANRQNLQNAAQLFGSIGTNAQQAGLAGAQAQLAAGQQQQQTQQAGLQALYNQFQQQQGFPYQQAQFLANIATGTGALSGNATSGTSTTTGGGGFFSDERLKENIKKVGETNDGQPIYRYNYKGDQRTQIGLLAQDVEKKHPEAVGLAGGYKTVNYKKATEDAIHKEDGGGISGTDAYLIKGPSAMLQENSGKGLGAMPSLPQAFMGGRDIPIEAGASGAGLAAMRSPTVTGFAPGVREGKEAELASLQSSMTMPPGPNGELLGSGKPYLESRINTLQDWLNQNNSQGGLVSGPGNFARGGLAEGGYMNPALAYYSPQQAQGGLYGAQLQPLAQRQILQGTPMQAPQQRQQPDAITSANQMAGLVGNLNSAYKARPDFLRSAEDVKARAQTAEAIKAREILDIAKARKLDETGGGDDLLEGGDEFARGGYAGRGYVNPYGGLGGNDILGPVLEEQEQQPQPQMMKGPEAPGQKPQQQSGGLGDVVSTGLKAKSAYDLGNKAYKFGADKLGLGGDTAMSATSAEALPGVIDLTSGAGLTGAAEGAGIAAAAPEALSAGLAGGEALAGGAAAAEGVAAAAAAAEAAAAAAAAAEVAAGAEAALAFLPFLSDERAKRDIKKVGTLFDGQPVYRFKYNGDDKTQMGLIAQKVEKSAPGAVGLAGGMKTVDYHRATNKAAKRGHFDEGGFLVPEDYVTDADFTPPPGLAGAEGGNEDATTGGDGGDGGKTVVGRSAPDVRPAPRLTPENAVVATAPREPPPGVASASRPSTPSKSFFPEITSEGVRDTLSSENFWVPALAGLGSMLASPNKTLAGAIGSGLVGGTGAYTGLQKQQADQLMKRLEMSKGRFKGPTLQGDQDMYLDTIVGDYVTEAEMGRRQGQFIGAKVSGTAMGAPAQSSTPGGTAGADAVVTARKAITEEAPAIQPRAPATVPPAKKEEAAAPAAAPSVPKPAEPDPNRILSKPEMIAAVRRDESLFQHLPEDRRPLSLEAEAKRLEDEGKAYLRQSQEEARRSGLTKGSDERGRLEAASKRFADLAKDRREEAAKRREEANNLFEGAIASQLKEAEARIAKTVERDFAEEIAPSGEKVRLPPGVKMPPVVAPEPTPTQQAAPKVAEVDPKTARLVLARPVAPAGGGLIQPTNLPPGTKVSEISTAAKNQSTMDEQFQKDFMEKAPSVGQARQRYMGLVNAFKLFESGSTETKRAGWAALAQTFGAPVEIVQSIASGDPAGVQWVEKIGPNLVLETLKAATPRFAQSEFMTLQDKGTPEPNKLPQANFQMVKEGLATLNRTDAFMQAWQTASQEEGWRSPSAYYAAWSKANPIEKFEQAAERQMGNFSGMPLPKASEWAPGAVYVVPKSLSGEQKAFFDKRGLKAGDAFQYGGAEAPPDQVIRPIPKQQLYSIPAMRQ
jgi:hypothetical protein